MLSWALVIRQPVGKCQILMYLESLADILGCQAVAVLRTKEIITELSEQY